MSFREKIKGMVDYKKYLKTLALSTVLAILTLYIAFGVMFFALEGNSVPGPFILLTFATFFIVFTVFYESKGKAKSKGKDKERVKGKESLRSLIKGLFLGICATFAFVATIGGVRLMLDPDYGVELIGGLGSFISALAICMVVSMVFLSLFRSS